MLCYKDKTFCNSDCTNKECHRYFGEEQQQGARKWWSHDPDNAPVAMCNFSPDCEGYKQEDKK